MANVLKKIKRNIARKKRAKNESANAEQTSQNIDKYKSRKIRQRKRLMKSVGVLLVIIVLAALVISLVLQKKVYRNYTVIESSKNDDTQSSKYMALQSNVLKYGNDGASLVDVKDNILWNQTYEMQNPAVDSCNDTVAIYDQKGTSMCIFTKDGLAGSVDTSMPILKARVAHQGVVAAILEDGDKTWINFYASDGSKIADNQTRIDSPGYPVDLAISPDGLLIMVTYLYVEGGTTTSYVAYYNFGNEGQSKIDNIVSGFTYEGILIPEVAYLDENTSLAFREDGVSIYSGKQTPKETAEILVDKEIVSTFYDTSHIGMVFKSENDSKQYTMEVYNTKGKRIFSREFSIEYKEIKISDNMIIMNNESQVCLISLKGIEKYNGTIDEGNIHNIFKTGGNRYMMVTDSGIYKIKLN